MGGQPHPAAGVDDGLVGEIDDQVDAIGRDDIGQCRDRVADDADQRDPRPIVRHEVASQLLGAAEHERGDDLAAVEARRQGGESGSDDGRMVLAVDQGEDAHDARSVEKKTPRSGVTKVSG